MKIKIKEHGKMSDANFPNGLIVKKPHQNAPSFVKCKLSFKVDDFIQCLQQNNNNGWVNVDMKVSQKGVLYVEIDNWQPNQQQAPPQQGFQQRGQTNYPPQQQNQQPAQQQQQPQYQQPQQGNQAPQQQAPPQQPAPPQYDPDAPFSPTDNIPF
jgi:hypothetical protein